MVALNGCVDVETGTELAEDELRFGLPSQEFEDVTLTHSNAGEKLFKMTAPHLDRYDRKDKAIFYGGIEVFFYEDGVQSSHLTADSGQVLEDGEQLVAIGNVVVTTDTGTTILTPRLRWERDSKLITNDTTVTIITDYDTLNGTGLVATDDLKMKRILNPTGISHRNSEGDGSRGGMLLSPARPGEEAKADSALEASRQRGQHRPLSETMSVVGPSGDGDEDSTATPSASPFGKRFETSPVDSVATDSTTADTTATSGGGGS
ncbi:LPS export ABC transporter periplasmic protein LptC [bacterium]|nr:LPS export ABC transporter periplasmic protein LptC [bacterium]